jgi:hypothetical protein
MRAAIVPHLENTPSPERTQHLLSPVLFPVEKPGEAASAGAG